MGAPKKNQFWRKRSKHGRDKIIKDPKFLADASDEYFQWCIDNPILEIDFRGKDLIKIEIPHPRVFKKEEFARFCGVAQWRTIEELRNDHEDFSQIITQIDKIIADQKYTYAVVGMFNSTIVSRDLGLADNTKTDVTSNGKEVNIPIINWVKNKKK
jgi:hypothetical protein